LPFAAHAGFALALCECSARGHLGNHQTCAMALGEPAERSVGDAGHWSQNHTVRHFYGAYLQRIAHNPVYFTLHGISAYQLGDLF
jgi:hypothetical protein